MYAVIDLSNDNILSFTMDEDGLTKKFNTVEEATAELKQVQDGIIFDLSELKTIPNDYKVVTIQVKKGVAIPTFKPKGILLTIFDLDGEENEQECFEPDVEIINGKPNDNQVDQIYHYINNHFEDFLITKKEFMCGLDKKLCEWLSYKNQKNGKAILHFNSVSIIFSPKFMKIVGEILIDER
ncbi:MAG: hypothetical protein ACFE95_09765 [Candidatus Hodarchaeota archaeon]